jgi:hypothetical protein
MKTLFRLPSFIEMDFQRLFKRKEEGTAPSISRENTRDTLIQREVLVREGDLLDGNSPASLVWSNVGGAITVKAEKILGILEGRTRIKAEILQQIYPDLFDKVPSPGTEFKIPLQTVVMQLQDLFANISSNGADLDDFNTPFGQLAREDEARFKNNHPDRYGTRPLTAPELYVLPELVSQSILKERDHSAGAQKVTGNDSAEERKAENSPIRGDNGFQELQSAEEKVTSHASSAIAATINEENQKNGEIREDPENHLERTVQPKPEIGRLLPAFESHHTASGPSSLSSGVPGLRNSNVRREGLEHLQELYLTDEPLDGCKVAELILQLPRVTGVVTMLADGAVLGGGLSGGLSETLLNLTPDFVTHLLAFTQSMEGGPTSFVTFSGRACQISLSIGGDVMVLVGHAGKNLPPGLRERLVATAQALNLIYGSPS